MTNKPELSLAFVEACITELEAMKGRCNLDEVPFLKLATVSMEIEFRDTGKTISYELDELIEMKAKLLQNDSSLQPVLGGTP
ncbi:hypothetical protein [Acinetobacter proteolyticus]|uniref:Uncharacterized protein n=1 Tax=Acinetobacter proteolyticus TaxID=1776741 RepID=A0A2N0WIA8_9GAMM|nr:hypothetical protein [Acinetobacter proteolyticus]PKF35503.1 hypothetical protein CW311_04230 [Acinetobacter proteolyticus]